MSEQAIDEAALGSWLDANVEGFIGPFELTKFASGQSNPTYKISAASGEYVLRRKPFGKLLPSAHAVDREYRLLAALHPLDFPVPRPLALCADPDVIGAIFYVMELAHGPPLCERRPARIRPADPPVDLRAAGRHACRPPQHRSRSRGAGRLRQARQLFRAPGDALDPPVSRLARPIIFRRWSG